MYASTLAQMGVPRLPSGSQIWTRPRPPRSPSQSPGSSKELFSAFKGVGGGVLEYRVDFGPGYRVYFGLDGDTLVILLGGGTKKRQQRDIEIAKSRWTDYKQRKTTSEVKHGADT